MSGHGVMSGTTLGLVPVSAAASEGGPASTDLKVRVEADYQGIGKIRADLRLL